MKRLTLKDKNGWYLTGDGIYSDWGVPEKFRGEDIDHLAAIEDILGDDYELDRLRELAQADKEGRVRIKCKAFCLTPRLDNQFYYCFNCKTQFTREKAEAALRREQE